MPADVLIPAPVLLAVSYFMVSQQLKVTNHNHYSLYVLLFDIICHCLKRSLSQSRWRDIVLHWYRRLIAHLAPPRLSSLGLLMPFPSSSTYDCTKDTIKQIARGEGRTNFKAEIERTWESEGEGDDGREV
jgi:hypothetical protein